MQKLIYAFDYSSIKFNTQILLCLIGIWVVIVGCVISSINARPFSDKERRFWILLVTFVPVIGTLAYLPFSFHHDELPPFLMPRHRQNRRRKRRTSRPSLQSPPSEKMT
jgi:uncharacterized membrane protein YhaH (DUF805 family)